MTKILARQSKIKFKLGDVVGIPLPDERFAYARIYRDFTLAIYEVLTSKLTSIEPLVDAKICFFQACTDSAIVSGKWPVIGSFPFRSEEDSWYPPKAVGYLATLNEWALGQPRIRERGLDRAATKEEVAGLAISSFCQRPELLVDLIVDRLIHGNHAKYEVPGE